MRVQSGQGRLTTHVLDTSLGKPAAGLRIDLYRISGDDHRTHLKAVTTNADGRTDEPMLEGGDMTAGTYELLFHAGDYLASIGAEAGFLDRVPIRFGITGTDEHYHVPLLLSPFAYSTYRGS